MSTIFHKQINAYLKNPRHKKTNYSMEEAFCWLGGPWMNSEELFHKQNIQDDNFLSSKEKNGGCHGSKDHSIWISAANPLGNVSFSQHMCLLYYTDGLISASLSSGISGEFKLIFVFRYIASKILNLTTRKTFHPGQRPPFKTITTQIRECIFQICWYLGWLLVGKSYDFQDIYYVIINYLYINLKCYI